MTEVIDVPEGVWRVVVTLTKVDGTRYRARRVVGRTAAQTALSSEVGTIGHTAQMAAQAILTKLLPVPK